jgi:outer membrane autotransporter protein
MVIIRKLVILTFIVVLYFNSLLCGRAYATAPWSFALIGDTRGGDDEATNFTGVSTYLNPIASKIASLGPSAVFVNGDLINGDDPFGFVDPIKYPGQDLAHPGLAYATQFANWGTAMQPVITAGIPIYTVRGNHENAALEITDTIPSLRSAYFNAFGTTDTTKLIQPLVIVPQNGPNDANSNGDQRGYTWNLTLNNIRVIAVDQYFYYAQPYGLMDNRLYYTIDQTWLAQQLSSATSAKYTFVMAHEPAYSLDSQGSFYGVGDPRGATNRGIFWDSLGSSGVKVYLDSHVHCLQVGTAQDSSGVTIYQIVTGNGGAPQEQSVTYEPTYTPVISDTVNYGFALFTVADNGVIVDFYISPNPSLGQWSIGYSIPLYSDLQSKATNSNASAVGYVLDNATTISADMSGVLKVLQAASDSQIASSLDTMHPTADRGIIETTNESLDKFVGATVLRLQDSKVEKGKDKSKSSADVPLEDSIWAQTYGDYANQDARGSSNGYLARLWGTAIGFDRGFLEDRLRLGFAQGFAGSQVLSADSSGRTGITSYQSCLYGEYEGKDHPYVLDTVFSYGHNDYDSSRSVTVAAINRTASANYHGDQFSSYLEGGYKFKTKTFDITPLLAIDYTHLHLSGLTETGADSLDLSVDAQNYDTLEVGPGCRISHVFDTKNMLFTPELHFRYFYAAVNDKQQTLASFAGGGTSFQTNGFRPAPSSFNLGARLEFFNKKNITLLADCDTSFKDGYYELGGSVTLKYSF